VPLVRDFLVEGAQHWCHRVARFLADLAEVLERCRGGSGRSISGDGRRLERAEQPFDDGIFADEFRAQQLDFFLKLCQHHDRPVSGVPRR